MKKLLALLTLTIAVAAFAQDSSNWDLRKCVDYAVKNNISVKQAAVQARIAAIQAKQLELYKYPSAIFSTNFGPQFGRSIDPTTNTYTNTELFSQNYGLQGGIQVYNWGRIKNGLAASQFNAQAAFTDIEKAANDVSLNVALYYLQVLASNESINISRFQIQQTLARIGDTKKKVDAGSLPELNLMELQAQLALDSTSLITNITSFDQNILALKGLLNIDASKPFNVETPPVEKIPVENLADLMPETVFLLAINNQPTQKSNDLKIKAAEKNVLANKAQLYPTISANYSLGSTYNNKAVNFSNGNKIQYFDQINQNFRQSLGIGLQVPIFNNGQIRSNYEQSKENVKMLLLQKELADQTLKNNIYTAYTNAVAAMQKFYAGKKQVETAAKVYEFSVKRYDVGLLGTLDLLINQNNLDRVRVQQISNQYDFIFRMKLLEFYKGQGLKL
ncbi:MAG: TolC family protein [Chitinophagaceae bacterium]|nr:TolC family protein [Chitinophagaceae bacterium]